MKKSILFDLLKLLTLFILIWAAFSYYPVLFPSKDAFDVSIEKEEQLGKLLVDEGILKDKRISIIRNPTLDSAMSAISKRLIDSIGLTDFEYKIRVIENPNVNAFTLPGGNIFIFSGLIKFSDRPEEVAAVLAHEIGHAEQRHIIKKLVKELGISVLFSVLTGGDAVMLDEITRTASSTVFDRVQEKEADDYSFALMDRSGINPKSLAAFFRRINSEIGSYDERMEFLMTHPNNNSRIKSALEYQTSPAFKNQPFNFNWEAVKLSLNSNSQEEIKK